MESQEALQRLRALKAKAGVSNRAISQGTGIPESTVTRAFVEGKAPSFETVAAICDFLGGSLDELAGLKPKANQCAGEDCERVKGLQGELEAARKSDHRHFVVCCVLTGIIAILAMVDFFV